MKRLAITVLACAFGAQAAELTVSVPADLVRHLSGGEIYRELPPGFPPFDMPEGLSVIGSQHRPPVQQVLLRSAPEGAAAQRAVVEALVARGWIDMSRAAPARTTGFIIPEGTGYDPASRGGVRTPPAPPALMQYLPTLDPPESPAAANVPFLFAPIGSSSGSNGSYETEMTVRSEELDAAGVNAHFAGQLREQGWRPDSEWAGDLTAGGVWTRSVEDGLDLLLNLSLSGTEDDLFSVVLTIAEVE